MEDGEVKIITELNVGEWHFLLIYFFNQDKDNKSCRREGGKKGSRESEGVAGLSWSMAKCKGRTRCHSV